VTLEQNMKLWNSVCTTDPKRTKPVVIGRNPATARKYTAIDPTYQNLEATKLWGPYGGEWGLYDIEIKTIQIGDEMTAMLKATFRYPGGSFPIVVDSRFQPGQDTLKKLQTSATSKALSKLGFNADIFLGMFDDVDYVTGLKERSRAGQEAVDRLSEKIQKMSTMAEMAACRERAEALLKSNKIDGPSFNELILLTELRRSELRLGEIAE
jgi:hypothetical protein